MFTSCFTIFTVAFAINGFNPTPSTQQPETEVKLVDELVNHPAAKMVGMWRGTVNSMGRDGQWHEAVAVERARWNLAGTAILVEGYGYSEDPETGTRVNGHDAVGLIEWDTANESAVFHAHRAGEEFKRYTFELANEGESIRWHMEPGPGITLRFTITLTDDRWFEVGEMSRDDGKNWMKFLETDLARVVK